MEKLLAVIGRVIYSAPFLVFGLNHLTNAPAMGAMVPAFIPGGILWIYFTGAAMVLAALAIITGLQARNACFGLALMLALFIALIHLPGMADPQTHMMSLVNVLKDTGLLGGALVVASTFPPKKAKK
ncbi:MAG TPA: DoxX family membrane protein [bacterium]|nr:DoxX family membrane protein [bacterium]